MDGAVSWRGGLLLRAQEDAGSVLEDGNHFSLQLRVCHNDWDLLKMGVCTRSLDEETLI